MTLPLRGWMPALLWLASTAAAAQSASFYPLELVKPGQKGHAKTVFEGTTVESFGVEILGVLKNVGPQQDVILARLSGERLAKTGVFAGMSGSPVFLDDKLVGAIAFSFPFAKDPIAGITPIQQMVDIFKERPHAPKPEGVLRFPRSLLTTLKTGLPGWLLPPEPYRSKSASSRGAFENWGDLQPIATAVSFSGFSPAVVHSFLPQLRMLGLEPVRGSGSAAAGQAGTTPLEPGSTVSVQLVRGDMDISASGTVTHLSGNRVYAFGHPFLSIGYTDLPLNKATVVAIIPSLASSEKISATTDWVGAIKQDRATGILGVTGEQARLIPVRLKLRTSRNETREFNYEVVTDSFLTPFLIAFTVQSSIVSSERAVGGQTLQVKCIISVKGQTEVNFENSVSDLASSSVFAAVAAAAPVHFLLNSGFENLVMEKISLGINAMEQTHQATLDKVWQDKLEVRPGEQLNLTVFVRKPNGEIAGQKYPVKIPDDIAPGPLKILVADGESMEKSDAETELDDYMPETLPQLIKAINNLKKNDRFYIRLYRDQLGAIIGGEALPDLPPSLLALYKSEKTTGDVKPFNKVIYVEHELPATDFVLTGQQVIKVNVKS